MSSPLAPAVLALVLAFPAASGAQGVAPADAAAFMGTWAINVDTPGGPITVDLTVKDVAGKVAAEIGGGDIPMTAISEIARSGSSLVLKYQADVGGAMAGIVLTTEVSGDTLKASFDVGGQVLPATGRRK